MVCSWTIACRKRARVAIVLATIWVAFACGAGPAGPSAAGAAGGAARRLIVVTHTTGFRHSSISVAETTLMRLAGESGGLFTVTLCRDAAGVQRLLSPEGLQNADAVFFANTTGNLGIPDLGAFLAWIRAGHAFLGTHSATDTYHDAPAYLEMIGAEFATHGNQATVDIRVDDRSHPSTVNLPSPFRVFDEIYEFRSNPRAGVSVLLSLDRHPDDGHPDAGRAGDFVLAWFKTYGAGRVFYTALGHREEVWEDPRFVQHLAGGIRWALE